MLPALAETQMCELTALPQAASLSSHTNLPEAASPPKPWRWLGDPESPSPVDTCCRLLPLYLSLPTLPFFQGKDTHSLSYTRPPKRTTAWPLIYAPPPPGKEEEFRLLLALVLKSDQTGRTSMLTPSHPPTQMAGPVLVPRGSPAPDSPCEFFHPQPVCYAKMKQLPPLLASGTPCLGLGLSESDSSLLRNIFRRGKMGCVFPQLGCDGAKSPCACVFLGCVVSSCLFCHSTTLALGSNLWVPLSFCG